MTRELYIKIHTRSLEENIDYGDLLNKMYDAYIDKVGSYKPEMSFH